MNLRLTANGTGYLSIAPEGTFAGDTLALTAV
jgi:hypothetical protein